MPFELSFLFENKKKENYNLKFINEFYSIKFGIDFSIQLRIDFENKILINFICQENLLINYRNKISINYSKILQEIFF